MDLGTSCEGFLRWNCYHSKSGTGSHFEEVWNRFGSSWTEELIQFDGLHFWAFRQCVRTDEVELLNYEEP